MSIYPPIEIIFTMPVKSVSGISLDNLLTGEEKAINTFFK